MFDLEQSIAAWRQQMLSAGIQTDADLDELEDHLREETARRMGSGMAAPEAFEAAVRQLGSTDALRTAFGKATWLAPARLRRWGAIAFSLELAVYTVLQARQLWKAGPSHHELTLGIVGLVATLVAACVVWRLAPGMLSRVESKTVRSSIVASSCAVAMVWLIVFVEFILSDLVLTPGQFAVVFLWAMLPLVVVPAVAAGYDQREREFIQ